MSATMSGDTPLGQPILPKSRFEPQNHPRDTSAQLLGSAKYPITKNTAKHEKPNKTKGSRAIRALAGGSKTCYTWYPRNTTDTSGGDHTMTQLLTVDDVQTALAVSRATVWRLIQSGELETIHIRRAIRIPADALETYIDNARLLEGSKR